MLTLQIKRWGNSAAIRLPNSILQQLGWHDDDELNLEVIDGQLIISKRRITIDINPDDYETLKNAGVDVDSEVKRFIASEVSKLKT